MNLRQEIGSIHFPATKTTIVAAICSALEHAQGFKFNVSEAMGYTSHAFRININPKSAEIAGPTSYDGGIVLQRGIENLGYNSVILDPPARDITPDVLASIITEIKISIDRGIPVIGWNFFEKEFGVICGYDDSLQVLYAKDGNEEGTIPYERLPIRRILCLGIIGEPLAETKRIKLQRALDMIVRHGDGNDGLSFNNCWHGLRGYDAWIRAYENGKISPKGNAYNVHVILDARKHAVAFLEHLSNWDDDMQDNIHIRAIAKKAIQHYAAVVEAFARLKEMYPYPLTSKSLNPRLKENAAASIPLLLQAKTAEEQGLLALSEIFRMLHSDTVEVM